MRRFFPSASVWAGLVACVLTAADAAAQTTSTPGVFSVRDFGAKADGETLDTAAINRAIDAAAAAGGGQVLLPPGRYLSGTVHLKSDITFRLAAGARLVSTPDLEQYQHYQAPAGTPEARHTRWHRALILAVRVKNVTITGPGVIDGNKVFDARGEERMRGPHTIMVGESEDVTVRDVDIVDSANYAVMVEFSSRVEVRGVKMTGGWDGVHFRGWKERPCRDLSIVDCQFFTGDDSIAGRYAENVLISRCVVNTSCNGIRIIGPVKGMIVHDCLFYGPGVHPHRTQDRHNMLCGIILQPGAWDPSEGVLEDVLISDVTMRNVTSAVTLFLRRPGNEARDITVSRLDATGVYRAAASVESWSDTAVEDVVFRDVTIEYTGGGTVEQGRAAARKPGVGARPLPAWGFYARNVERLVLDDVRLRYEKEDLRPALVAENVGELVLDNFDFLRPEATTTPLRLDGVRDVTCRRQPFDYRLPRERKGEPDPGL